MTAECIGGPVDRGVDRDVRPCRPVPDGAPGVAAPCTLLLQLSGSCPAFRRRPHLARCPKLTPTRTSPPPARRRWLLPHRRHRRDCGQRHAAHHRPVRGGARGLGTLIGPPPSTGRECVRSVAPAALFQPPCPRQSPPPSQQEEHIQAVAGRVRGGGEAGERVQGHAAGGAGAAMCWGGGSPRAPPAARGACCSPSERRPPPAPATLSTLPSHDPFSYSDLGVWQQLRVRARRRGGALQGQAAGVGVGRGPAGRLRGAFLALAEGPMAGASLGGAGTSWPGKGASPPLQPHACPPLKRS
jgi:hypothetical protein